MNEGNISQSRYLAQGTLHVLLTLFTVITVLNKPRMAITTECTWLVHAFEIWLTVVQTDFTFIDICRDLTKKSWSHVLHYHPLKVIQFNCISHPFCASFFAWLASARARARSELGRFSMKTELFRVTNCRFLPNKLGDPTFLLYLFQENTILHDISKF